MASGLPRKGGRDSESRRRLNPVIEQARLAFDRAKDAFPDRVVGIAPILFFGDFDSYMASAVRVLTVAKNPSDQEFPQDDPLHRFPRFTGNGNDRKPRRYTDAMSDYFREAPYASWFGDFEHVLEGAGASYGDGAESTALHTDICSPVATHPTWTGLDRSERRELQEYGVPLWHRLLTILNPHVVLLSFRREHLSSIEFTSLTGWRTIRRFKRTRDGKSRSVPYRLYANWYEVAGDPSLFLFGQGAQKPFGPLSHKRNNLKRKAGEIALARYRKGAGTARHSRSGP